MSTPHTMANVSLSSGDDEDADNFSSQFAALLKPIRELTKQGCWELNIAEKLEEYIQYIGHLDIEVNVNGERVKLDFAKAAMVVQNSVQIYSKKVENLWLLLQEVMEFLSSHGRNEENDQGEQNPALSRIKRVRRRHQKGDVDLLEETQLKFRKSNSKVKKKTPSKELKRIQTLPYEILRLEEAVGSGNPLKIKLFTLANEHLCYPSELRSNFPFDPLTFFLKIEHYSVNQLEYAVPNQDEQGNVPPELQAPEAPQPAVDNFDVDEPPDLSADWQNDEDQAPENLAEPPQITEPRSILTELRPERNARLAEKAPVPANNQKELIEPWQGIDPYSDEKSAKKPCGPPVKSKIPAALQTKKRKSSGRKSDKHSLIGIDEYLSKSHMTFKKRLAKHPKPDSVFWEDYVHFTKTTGLEIKKNLKSRLEEAEIAENDAMSHEEDRDDGNAQDDFRDDIDMEDMPGSPAFGGANELDFHLDPPELGRPHSPASVDLDESKQFFQLVQEFMTEYTASAQNFVHSTESSRRVQAWHEMIQPRLQEAESRRDFDIHLYGSRILEAFGTQAPLGSRTSFSNVIHNEPKNEVARYFLAVLQLANAYNIEIALQKELSLDAVQLQLLSRERHHEHMDEFT